MGAVMLNWESFDADSIGYWREATNFGSNPLRLLVVDFFEVFEEKWEQK